MVIGLYLLGISVYTNTNIVSIQFIRFATIVNCLLYGKILPLQLNTCKLSFPRRREVSEDSDPGIHWMPDQARHDGISLFNCRVNNVRDKKPEMNVDQNHKVSRVTFFDKIVIKGRSKMT